VNRDRVRVAGPDAEAFLQGQLSQDVTTISVGESKLSFLLQPQGKVDALLTVHRLAGDEFLLETDEGWGEVVVTRLNRFKLRTKADIELIDPVEDGDDEASRIAAGRPRMGAEVDERTIPAELGQSIIERAVSFTKGCYTGQELVARIDSRGGHAPRQLRRIRLAAGAPIGAVVEVDGKNVGTLTSVAGTAALGLVGRAVEPPASAASKWDGGHTTGEIEALTSA